MTRRKNSRSRIHRLLAALCLFQKALNTEAVADERADLKEEEGDFGRIRCPLCSWQPSARSRWCCADCPHPENFIGGCGAVWNTFDTRGLCPGCGHQWRWTYCPKCHQMSPHEDWYLKKAD